MRSFHFLRRGLSAKTVLKTKELWALIPALKLVLLEHIAERGLRLLRIRQTLSVSASACAALRDASQAPWKDVLEPLILPDHVLREDPAGAYSRMDFDSRDLYRNKLVEIAEHSDFSEMEVATEALALAREAQQRKESDPRVALRRSHIGYYLVAEGSSLLHQRVGFTPPFPSEYRHSCADTPMSFTWRPFCCSLLRLFRRSFCS